MIGCELTLFNPGYLPGTYFYDRIRSGTGEPVDWSRFDIVSLDAYRDEADARSFAADLRKRTAHRGPRPCFLVHLRRLPHAPELRSAPGR